MAGDHPHQPNLFWAHSRCPFRLTYIPTTSQTVKPLFPNTSASTQCHPPATPRCPHDAHIDRLTPLFPDFLRSHCRSSVMINLVYPGAAGPRRFRNALLRMRVFSTNIKPLVFLSPFISSLSFYLLSLLLSPLSPFISSLSKLLYHICCAV